MAIEKMVLVRASGRMQLLDKYISEACLDCDYGPENALSYISDSFGYAALSEQDPYEAQLHELEELSGLVGKPLTRDSQELSDTASQGGEPDREGAAHYIQELRDHIKALYDKRKAAADEIAAIDDRLRQYSHFLNLEVKLDDLLDCRFLSVRFGRLTKDAYAKLAAYRDNPYVFFTLCQTDKNDVWGIYCAPHSKVDAVDRIFASLYFERYRLEEEDGTVAEISESLSKKRADLSDQSRSIDDEITDYWAGNSVRIKELYSMLLRAWKCFSLRRYAAQKNGVFYCVGWIPRKHEDAFRTAAMKTADPADPDSFSVDFEEPDEKTKADPPTKLRNPRIVRPFEYFVEMYGLPHYGGVDITPFLAVTYTVLFGIMFGDAGQGIVIALVGLLMWKKKKMALGKILVPCGICSFCFGLLFGSFFGYEHLMDPLYKAIGLSGKPISVMDSINTVLISAIAIGVGLVTCAMCINIYSCIKAKRYGEAAFSNDGAAGIVFYLSLASVLLKFMGGPEVIPAGAAKFLIIITLIILFLKDILIGITDRKEGWKPDSVSDFIMQNIFEVVEYVLSYFSNTVSFLRVGAFVLVHAGMMMVVFSLAGASENIVVIILGNIVVIALEGLLTGIQALRLEFYEMFSRCFEGDGHPFIPAITKNRA